MGCGSSKVAPLLTSHASATGDTVVGAAFLLDGCPVAGEEPAASTDDGLCLLIIDPQNDFHPPNGSLAVPGAVEDTERVIAMLNRLSDQITNVVVSLDSHNPLHIANPGFWRRGDDGSYARPKPFTIITAVSPLAPRTCSLCMPLRQQLSRLAACLAGQQKEVKDGAWEAADPALTVWAQRYAEQLEAGGRFKVRLGMPKPPKCAHKIAPSPVNLCEPNEQLEPMFVRDRYVSGRNTAWSGRKATTSIRRSPRRWRPGATARVSRFSGSSKVRTTGRRCTRRSRPKWCCRTTRLPP